MINAYKNIADNIRYYNGNKNLNSYNYIEPQKESLYGFVECLLNKNLITDNKNYNIIDIGFGLGTSLYNLYLQFSKHNINNKYYGIDNDEYLYNYFNTHLKHNWYNLTYNTCDIFDHEYHNYDILYMYSPFKDDKILLNMYDKIIQEMKPGAILFEYYNHGRGYNGILYNYLKDKNIQMIKCHFGDSKKLIYVK